MSLAGQISTLAARVGTEFKTVRTEMGTLDRLPMGASFHVVKSGANWTTLDGVVVTARPTARTDLRMICECTDGVAPTWALAGDLVFVTS